MLLLVALIAFALFVICYALIYNNRNLTTDSEVQEAPDFSPGNSDSFSFSFSDEQWGKEYMAVNGYLNHKRHCDYHVEIKEPFASKLIFMDTLVAMGNGADVIFTQNRNLIIKKVSVKESVDEIIEKELDKYCDRQFLPGGHMCNKITLQDVYEIPHYKTMIQAGIPVRIGRIAILSDKVVYGDELTYPRSRDRTLLAPKNISSKMPGFPCKIPKIFHQTFESTIIAEQSAHCVNAWIQSNPDYDYRYHTGEDCRDLIAKEFSSEVLAAYDTLYAGAFKADLWRLCVLYKYGGVYGDIKLFPAKPLYKIIDPNADLVLVTDLPNKLSKIGIYNAFMAATPGNPFIKRMIDVTVENIRQRRMTHFLDITGPIAIGREFEKYVLDLKSSYNMELGVHKITDDMTIQMLMLKGNMAIFDWCITQGDNIPLIYRRYKQDGLFSGDKVYRVTSGKPHYFKLFKDNAVYEKGV